MLERELEKIFCRLLYVLLPESSFPMLSGVVYKFKLHTFISLTAELIWAENDRRLCST
jgi:hypothetical protein